MTRRELIALLGGAAVAWPNMTGAQPQPKMLRVGFVGIQPRESSLYAAFLERMAELGCEIIHGAVLAYLNHDADEARRVAALDDAIDHEHKALVDEVLALMREQPGQVERAERLIKTSGFLERLGDHMTNICEAVVFMVEGRHVELNE